MAMLLGKRHRQSMRRTTSLTELSFNDLPDLLEPDSQTPDTPSPMQVVMEPAQRLAADSPVVRLQSQGSHQEKWFPAMQPYASDEDWLSSGLFPPAAPRRPRRNSGDFGADPAQFLRACGLCRRRLGPGRDTYMYRGEIAFCSMECRQQQMALDDRKKKCSLAANSSVAVQATAAGGTKATPATAAAGGTAAAA